MISYSLPPVFACALLGCSTPYANMVVSLKSPTHHTASCVVLCLHVDMTVTYLRTCMLSGGREVE